MRRALLALAVVAAPAGATSWSISSTVDAVAVDGTCTLREAIRAAATDLAVNECAAGGAVDEIVLAVDLPGISEEAVSLEVDDGVLTISGERSRTIDEKHDRYYRFERRFGQFSRSVTLPQGIDASGIKAEFDAGVLEVHVPKPEERKPRKISIGVGNSPKTIETEGASA